MVKRSAIAKFVEAVNASPELTRECEKALDGSKDAKKFVALGRKHGFKFTQSQARAYFRDVSQAPSGRALSKARLKAEVGAKVEDFPAPGRGQQLKNAISMLRGMSFKRPPEWT